MIGIMAVRNGYRKYEKEFREEQLITYGEKLQEKKDMIGGNYGY